MQSSDCVDSEKSTTDKPDRKIDNIPYQQILELFRSSCPSLSTPMIMTDKRKTAIRAIWKMDAQHQDMNFWEWYFKKIEASDFLARNSSGSKWRATFDFAINKNNMVKAVEGAYDNR